jgi:UDP-glucose 4-epimerase
MVLALIDAGETVVFLDDLSTGFCWAVPEGAEFVQGDIGDSELIRRLLLRNQIEAIIHFAGSIVVPDSVRDPLGYYLNNTCKSRTLIACAIACNVPHFIFSSTAMVYGARDTKPIPEESRLDPISPYGKSKLMTEAMLHDAADAHGLRYVILRYFNVAGADPLGRSGQSTPDATHLIKVAVQTALGRRPFLEVYGTDYPTPDGTCIRDYVHVSDLVRAHLHALDYLREGGESDVLNCGYGRGASVLDVLESVRRVARTPFEVRIGPRRVGDTAALVAEAIRIGKVLRWKPRYDDLDTIIGDALSWERRLGDLRLDIQPSGGRERQ